MSFTVRAATPDEIDWIRVQLNPADYYLRKFEELGKTFAAIDVDSPRKASTLKGKLAKEINKRTPDGEEPSLRVDSREEVVFIWTMKEETSDASGD